MDFAFVPGTGDASLDVLRAVMQLRPNTTVDIVANVTTVADFFGHLDFVLGILGDTAGDLIVGSHGSAEGQLQISLDSKIPTPDPKKQVIAVYEDLEAVNTSGSIRIPTDIESPNTNFRLAGCLIGSKECEPFLKMLKQALGNPKSVSAPKYIHSFQTAPDGSSAFEFMCYAYRVVSKKALTKRDQVLGLFGNLPDDQKQLLGGGTVPDENWDNWIPVAAKLNLAPSTSQDLAFHVPVKIAPAAGGMTALPFDAAHWYSTYDEFDFKVQVTDTMPPDDAGKIALVPLALPNINNMKSTHLYPVYTRYHFKTLTDFANGMTWKPTELPGNVLQFVGKRYRYELHIPVFKPSTPDELIYNFYPVSGTPQINFNESNTPFALYGVV